MKKLLFIICTFALFTFAAVAQDVQPTPQTDSPKRPNLMKELGLSTDQMRAIRQINQTQKPKTELAQRSLRQTRKVLDDAIYAESFVESDIQAKTKDVQLAEAELTKVKTETEFAIRKVLTPDQLLKFRELRMRLMKLKQQERPILKQLKRFPNREQQPQGL